MIHGLPTKTLTARERILDQLNDLACDFYLTGSLFFEDCLHPADVDLFMGTQPVYSDVSIWESLQQLGFEEEFTDYFQSERDGNLWRVLRHSVGIDIQVVFSVAEKMQTQALIKHYGLLYDVPKEDHVRVWQKARECVVNINFLHNHSEEAS